MAKTPDNKPAGEPVSERTYSTQDIELLLNWIRDSIYYPGGMNGWGRRDFSPYYKVTPAMILENFNEYLDQRAKQQPGAQPKTSTVK